MKITHVRICRSAAAFCGCALCAIAIPALVMSIYALVRIDDRATLGTAPASVSKTVGIEVWPTYDFYTELTKSTSGEPSGYSFWKNWNARAACTTLWKKSTNCSESPTLLSGELQSCIDSECAAKYSDFGDDRFPHFDLSQSGTVYYQDTYISAPTVLDPITNEHVSNGNPYGFLVRPYNWIFAADAKINSLLPPYLNSGGVFIRGFNKYATQAATHLSVAFSALDDAGNTTQEIKTVNKSADPGLMRADTPTYTVVVPNEIGAATVRIVSAETQSVAESDLEWLMEIYQFPFDYQNSVDRENNYSNTFHSYDFDDTKRPPLLTGYAWPAIWLVNDNLGSKTTKSLWPMAPNMEVDLAEHYPNTRDMYYVPEDLQGFYSTVQTNYVHANSPGYFAGTTQQWPYPSRCNIGNVTRCPDDDVNNRLFSNQWIQEKGPVLFGIKIGKQWSSLTIVTVTLASLVDNDINWRETCWSSIMANDKIEKVVQFQDTNVPAAMHTLHNFSLTITQPVQHFSNSAADMLQRGYTSRQASQVDEFQAPFWNLRAHAAGPGQDVSDAQWKATMGNKVPLLPSDFLLGDSQIRKVS